MSKIIAVEIAIINNFIWNDRWTFRDASSSQKGLKAVLIRFVKFNVACTIGAIINISLFLILVKYGINLLLANLLAIVISTAWNYLINLKFNWRAP